MTSRCKMLALGLVVAAVGGGCSSAPSTSPPAAPVPVPEGAASVQEPNDAGGGRSLAQTVPQSDPPGPLDLLQEGLESAASLLTGELGEVDIFESPGGGAAAAEGSEEPPVGESQVVAVEPQAPAEAPSETPQEPADAQQAPETALEDPESDPADLEGPDEPPAPEPPAPEPPRRRAPEVPSRIARAGDPLTSAAELAGLATDPTAEIRRAVAANPSAPVSLLSVLLDDADPGVRWLAAANPSLWPEFWVLADRPITLTEFLELFPYSPWIPADPETDEPGIVELAELLRDEAEAAASLDEDQDWHTERLLDYLSAFAAEVPDLPSPLPEGALTGRAAFESWLSRAEARTLPPDGALSRRAIADNPAPWHAVVPLLVADYKARQWAAANPTTPPDQLLALAADPRGDVGVWVGTNPAAPPAALALLARRADDPARRAVSDNPATPPSVLAELAADDVAGVRRGAARHPATPPSVLAELATDDDTQVRSEAAANAATPAATLAKLAGDDDALVRLAVAEHPSTPSWALLELLSDGDRWVRWAAANNPSLPADALESLDGEEGVVGRRAEPIDPPPPDPPPPDPPSEGSGAPDEG